MMRVCSRLKTKRTKGQMNLVYVDKSRLMWVETMQSDTGDFIILTSF